MRRFLTRRRMLRGLLKGATVGVALPRLPAMLDGNGQAYADGGPLPRRFVLWFWGGGVLPGRWVPTETGPNWALTPQLEPLAALKPSLSVLSGCQVITAGAAHAAGAAGITTGTRSTSDDAVLGPSIDQVIAQAWATQTPHASLCLGVSTAGGHGKTGVAHNFVSHIGPGTPNPIERDPSALFRRLFGAAPGGPGADLAHERLSVLDAVRGDLAELHAEVGPEDRRRLDDHLDGLRALERRLTKGLDAGCTAMPPPAVKKPAIEVPEATTRAMSDLLALAFACDLTRVAAFQLHSPGAYANYGVGALFHNLQHGEPDPQPLVDKCVVATMKHLAITLSALAARREGEASLLDRAAVLATSDVSLGRSHSLTEYPLLLAGKAGGALRAGVHHRAQGENANRVTLAIAHALGVRLQSWGQDFEVVTKNGSRTKYPAKANEPLGELLLR